MRELLGEKMKYGRTNHIRLVVINPGVERKTERKKGSAGIVTGLSDKKGPASV